MEPVVNPQGTSLQGAPTPVSKWLGRSYYSDDLSSGNLRFLFYGEPGSGKTSLISTFPDPFIIDADGGMLTLSSKHIPGFPLKHGENTFMMLSELLLDIRQKRNGFEPSGPFGNIKTLAIDSLSKLADYLKEDIMMHPVQGMGKNGSTPAPKDPTQGKAEWDHYTLLKERLGRIIDLCKELPLHFVASAWVDYDLDKEGKPIKAQPNIVGGYKKTVGGNFDGMFYMEDRGPQDPAKRFLLRTTSYGLFPSKTRIQLPPALYNTTFETFQEFLRKA